MEVGLCLSALNDALADTGHVPEIFNTDQGCQFTSAEWTGRLIELDVRISMDGKGRWMDNVFIERLWRSVKYEEIYLREHATIPDLETGLTRWFRRYNAWRPHQALGNLTPQVVYQSAQSPSAARGGQCSHRRMNPQNFATIFGSLHSRLRSPLRYAPWPAPPSVPASKNRILPPAPHFNLAHASPSQYTFPTPSHHSLF